MHMSLRDAEAKRLGVQQWIVALAQGYAVEMRALAVESPSHRTAADRYGTLSHDGLKLWRPL